MHVYRYSLNLTSKVFKNSSIVSAYFKSGKTQVQVFHSLELRKILTIVNLLKSIHETSQLRFLLQLFEILKSFQFRSSSLTLQEILDKAFNLNLLFVINYLHSTSTFQNEGLVENYLSKFLREKKYNFYVLLKLLEEKISFIICKCLE